MHDFAELTRAIAALLWPIVVLLVLLAYRHEVKTILARLRRAKGKVLGQELEVELDALQSSAVEAQEQSARVALPPAERPSVPEPHAAGAHEGAEPEYARDSDRGVSVHPTLPARPPEDPVERVLQDSAISPKLGVVALAAELERTMRRILASSQPPGNWERRALPHMG